MNFNFTRLLIFLTFANHATAQVEFFKSYGLPNRNETLIAIQPAPEAGQYWAAGTTGSVGHDDFFRVKLDSDGNILKADTFGSPLHNETLTCFVRDPATGDYWLGGAKKKFDTIYPSLVALRTNEAGQILKEIELPVNVGNSNEYGVFVAPIAGGQGYIIVGLANPNFFVMRYDNNEKMLWKKTVSNIYSFQDNNLLAATPEGGVFISLNAYNSSIIKNNRLVYINPVGQLEWEKNIFAPGGENKSEPISMAYDSGDSTAVVFHRQITPPQFYWLTKLDLQGKVIWQKALPQGSSYYPYPAQLMVGENAELGLLRRRGLERFDRKTGEFLSMRDFSNDNPQSPQTFAAGLLLSDSTLIAVGESEVNYQSTDGFFARIHPSDTAFAAKKFIGTDGTRDYDALPRLTVDENGGFFIGSFGDYGAIKNADFALRKISASGTLIWEKNYGNESNEIFGDIARLADGTCLLVGQSSSLGDNLPDYLTLYKVTPDGDVVWEKRLPKKRLESDVRVAAMPDSGAVVLFRSNLSSMQPTVNDDHQMQALRLSATGDSIWQRRYFVGVPEAHNRSSINFRTLSDGTLVSTGACTNCTGNVLRINPKDGTPLLEIELEKTPANNGRRTTSAVLANNGDLLVMSINYEYKDSVYLYRLSPEGNVLQRKGLKIGEYHYASSLLRLSDGGLAAIIAYNFSNAANSPDGLFVRRLSETFAPLGSDWVLANVERRPEDAVALPGGGLALVGFVRPTNSGDIFLMKTLPIPTVSTQEPRQDVAALRVFPNPFGDQFWVEIQAHADTQAPQNGSNIRHLEISDPTGRILRRQNFTGGKMEIERGDLPDGMLFLTLKNAAGAVLSSGRAVAITSKN